MLNQQDEALLLLFIKINNIEGEKKERITNIYSLILEDVKLDFTINSALFKHELLFYILGELSSFSYKKKDEELKEEIVKKINTIYLNSKQDLINEYSPLVTNLKSSFIFISNINSPYSKTDPITSLINDIYSTIFKKIDSFSTMFSLKMYTEAFVSWRTIHESECIIKLLTTGGKEIQNSYVKHIAYNNAFRNPTSFSQEENDLTFFQLKKEMKNHGLKSKDMKKFIEYGWLYSYNKIDSFDDIKLNFRDGIEKLAGLEKYNYIYEGASELVHSSSSFFYVNDDFCKDLALDMTYLSSIRIFENYHDYFKSIFEDKKIEADYIYFYNLLKETLAYIQSNFKEDDLFDLDSSKQYSNYKENFDK